MKELYTADRIFNQKPPKVSNGQYDSYYNTIGGQVTGGITSGLALTSGPQMVDAYEMDNQVKQPFDGYDFINSDQMMSPPLEPLENIDNG